MNMTPIKGNIERLTHAKAEELIQALSSLNHRFTVVEVVEKDGERWVRTACYSNKRERSFVFDQSARVLAVASLKRYLAKDLLGQVESYQCEYDYFNNKFVENSSYSSGASHQHEIIMTLKQKLDDIKVFANELHIENLELEQLVVHDQNKKRQAKFNETIDHLIQVLSCD